MPQAYSSDFARAYNLRWGFFAQRAAPHILEYYQSTTLGRTEHSLLDLCCGTGVLSAYFLDRGYRVVGLDLSPAMLSYARQNTQEYLVAQQAEFVLGDASNFHLGEQFGLVLSTFDALNHLPDESALLGCFQCVRTVLKKGGSFIFDLNTRFGLRQWNGMSVDDSHPDALIINRGFLVAENDKAWTAITGFMKDPDGRYNRFDEVAYNTIFKMDRVQSLLHQSGFQQVRFALLEDLAAQVEDPESERRVFIVVSG